MWVSPSSDRILCPTSEYGTHISIAIFYIKLLQQLICTIVKFEEGFSKIFEKWKSNLPNFWKFENFQMNDADELNDVIVIWYDIISFKNSSSLQIGLDKKLKVSRLATP